MNKITKLEQTPENLCWEEISMNYPLDESFIERYEIFMDWGLY